MNILISCSPHMRVSFMTASAGCRPAATEQTCTEIALIPEMLCHGGSLPPLTDSTASVMTTVGSVSLLTCLMRLKEAHIARCKHRAHNRSAKSSYRQYGWTYALMPSWIFPEGVAHSLPCNLQIKYIYSTISQWEWCAELKSLSWW